MKNTVWRHQCIIWFYNTRNNKKTITVCTVIRVYLSINITVVITSEWLSAYKGSLLANCHHSAWLNSTSRIQRCQTSSDIIAESPAHHDLLLTSCFSDIPACSWWVIYNISREFCTQSPKTSYHQISRNLEAVRYVFKIIRQFWHLTGTLESTSWKVLEKLQSDAITLTHWGRATHICVSRLTITGPDNGLSPSRRHAIIWTNAGILLLQTSGTNFSEILS